MEFTGFLIYHHGIPTTLDQETYCMAKGVRQQGRCKQVIASYTYYHLLYTYPSFLKPKGRKAERNKKEYVKEFDLGDHGCKNNLAKLEQHNYYNDMN